MSPLLRKETRLLLPSWIAALVAATAPLWMWHDLEGLVPVLFGVAILALVLSPFGLETSYGTFGLLLVQPEDRRRFWRIKTGLLAVALVSTGALFILCLLNSSMAVSEVSDDNPKFLIWGVLLTFLAFSGGLWTTLLLRDMVSAFFCTLIVPFIISGAVMACVTYWIDKVDEQKAFEPIMWGALAAYGVAGFWWARRLFLRAQDVGWTGGQISLTSVRGISLRWLAFEFKGPQNPWTALVKKELQLQEIIMFLIPVLTLVHFALLTAYHFAPQRLSKEMCYNAIPFIWLVTVPFVIGCVTVAEERRLNTLEGQLCLPVTKRGQFAVKLAVALVLGIVLGGIIPWVLLRIGGQSPKDFEMRYVVEIAAAITGIAFYASTVSRGLLQALPTTVCIPMVAGMVMALIAKFVAKSNGNNYMWLFSSLFPTMVWPALIITLVWLAFNNYKRLQIGWRVWLGDFGRAGAVFGCVTLGFFAIFDRSWELFLPLEPSHGPPRMTGQASLEASWENVWVVLPDGRLWIGKTVRAGKKNHRKLTRVSGAFANGSNWVKIAVTGAGAAALQSDGTLWKISNGADIHQIGSDSDWKEVVAGGGTFLAVKQDGTLWGWGFEGYGIISTNLSRAKGATAVAAPIRVGNDSDWVNVFIPDGEHAVGIKRDGTAWQWGNIREKMHGKVDVHTIRQMVRLGMEEGDWRAMTSIWGETTFGIRSDGSLWAYGVLPPKIFGQDVRMSSQSLNARVGTKSDWVSLSGEWQQAALEANGTLWTMQYNAGDTQSKRPSKYSDWLAATQIGDLTWAVAKDGTLSCWNEFGIDWPDDKATFMQRFFLGPTRRPLVSYNILGQKP